MLPERQKSQLLSALNQEDFVKDTCKQLEKDLNYCNIEYPSLVINPSQEALPQLTELLSKILQKISQPDLQAFLYRVDLSEKFLSTQLTDKNDFEQFAEQIIIREAQKVYLRKLFS